jgi:hypothetical protein
MLSGGFGLQLFEIGLSNGKASIAAFNRVFVDCIGSR